MKGRDQSKSRKPEKPTVESDISRATAGEILRYLQEKAEKGDGAAACTLGDAYREGNGTKRNLKLSLSWYRRGADLGDSYAQNNLGSMLLNGMGCKRNPVKATQWYRSSAEQGNAEGQYNLAKRYLTGEGIGQDYMEARSWLERAAIQGHDWAACELGTLYMLGQGVERNLPAAATFHLLAAESGDELGARNLAHYREELEEIALSGNSMACLCLCRMSNRGFGAAKSEAMTWGWISLAKKYCRANTDPEIASEIVEAFNFYRDCVSAGERRAGQKSVAAMLAVPKKSAAATSHGTDTGGQ